MIPTGASIGPYVIREHLGSGGMGEVYSATDPTLKRVVALKLLPAAMADDPTRRARFQREAETLAGLRHAGIVTIFSIEEADGVHFLTMELIDGVSLAARLEEGSLPWETAVEYGAMIADALGAAHAQGVIHRDLKPANVMIDSAGQVRILDFGIARRHGDPVDDETATAELLTRAGGMLGTIAYMSPEQLRGEVAGSASDLFAFGIVLYQMLTGRHPFAAASAADVQSAILRDAPPPIRALDPELPDALAGIVIECLHKEPGRRPESAPEIGVRLRQAAAAAAGTSHAPDTGPAVRTLVASILAPLADSGDESPPVRPSTALRAAVAELLTKHGGTDVGTATVTEVAAVFSRPTEAVAFALEYGEAVARLQPEEAVPLGVRTGIHLTELELVARRPQEVAEGAAPLRPEGVEAGTPRTLATVARSRQVLLTRAAFDTARPGADRLAATPELEWLAHGPYQLDGIDEPLDIYEVGQPGVAPLQAPVEGDAVHPLTGDHILGWRPASGLAVPQRPRWRLDDKLAEGGFGEVWLAVHEKTGERRVFKFCFDPERLRGLQREITIFRLLKEALGSRDDISRILDWNFDEMPYFVESEYTAGGNLVEWAEGQGGLDAIPLATRLELVAQVADALAAAHSVGVLHKDVKPANILVYTTSDGEPRARLTDFGIGLATDAQRLSDAGITVVGMTQAAGVTDATAGMGTQLYLAPEVLEGKPPTMQADVYALGVMLYQVVVADPRRALAPGWERDVGDEVLRADIAFVVDGDPTRRLGNAARLAERLRTIEARRDELEADRRARQEAEWTRVALVVSRRRRKFAAAAIAVLLVVAGALGWQARRIAVEAERANREAEVARQVSGFLVDLFDVADPFRPEGEVPSTRDLLEQGVERVWAELGDQPDVQAMLMSTMGRVYNNLGLYEASQELLEFALGRLEVTHGPGSSEVAEARSELARVLRDQGQFARAEAAYLESIEARQGVTGERRAGLATSLHELGELYFEIGDLVAAERNYAEAARIRLEIFPSLHPDVATTKADLGVVMMERGDLGAAEGLFEESLTAWRSIGGDDHPVVAIVLNNFAYLEQRRGNLERAEQMHREALAIKESVLGPVHPRVAISLTHLAKLDLERRRFADAERTIGRALTILEGSLPADHWRAGIAHSVLGAAHDGLGRSQEAERLLLHGYELVRAGRGDHNANTYAALERLVDHYERAGRDAEASAFRETLVRTRAEHPAAGQGSGDR